MTENCYTPFRSEIAEVIKHTDTEYTFRLRYAGAVKPGQFFEVSLPKFGEAPISVSGTGGGLVDLTIRRVGRVTGEAFERYAGDALFLRGPYGNGFNLGDYQGKELIIVAGGTGVSPVRGVIDYFARRPEEVLGMTVIAGFKSPGDMLFRADFERWKEQCALILTVDAAEEPGNYQVGLVTRYIPAIRITDLSQGAAIVVGPPGMMRFSVKALCERGFAEDQIWISYERKMCCGLGKCGHCRIQDSYVCLDGPVFNFSRNRTLVD
jgi:anaerobic sulfite reductase subunit B